MIKVPKSNKHGPEPGGLGGIVGMHFFSIVDKRAREDSEQEGEDFV